LSFAESPKLAEGLSPVLTHSTALYILSTCSIPWDQSCAFLGHAHAHNQWYVHTIRAHARLGWSYVFVLFLTSYCSHGSVWSKINSSYEK